MSTLQSSIVKVNTIHSLFYIAMSHDTLLSTLHSSDYTTLYMSTLHFTLSTLNTTLPKPPSSLSTLHSLL